jgi:Circularly permutated YpsA SLOG family
VLSGGTKLTLDLASKLEKPVFHIYDTRKERISKADSLRFGIQALTDFLCSNKIEILNVAGPRIEGTGRLRVDAENVEISESGPGSTETAGRSKGGGGKSGGPSTWAAAILD